MKALLIYFLLANTAYANSGIFDFIDRHSWTKGVSDYRKDCFDVNKDIDYRAIIYKYCKIYSNKTKKTNPMLICNGGGLNPAFLFYKTRKECEKS